MTLPCLYAADTGLSRPIAAAAGGGGSVRHGTPGT